MPAVFLWAYKTIGPTRFVGGVIAVLMSLILFFGAVTIGLAAMTEDETANQANCSGIPWDEPYQMKGVNYLERFGEFVAKMTDGKNDAGDARMFIRAIRDTATLWANAFTSKAFKDADATKAVTGYRTANEEARRKARAACCVTQNPTNPGAPAEPPPPTVEPWDPKTASLQTGQMTQEDITRIVVREVAAAGLPDRAAVVMVSAGLQESGLRNLNYGDSSSVGVWQLINDHGTVAQRLDVSFSARWFITQLKGVTGWEQMSINDAAQAVERSGHPTLYGQHETRARELLAAVGGGTGAEPPTATTPTPTCPAGSGAVQGGVGTWNVHYGNSYTNVHAGLAAMSKTSGVIGLQEVSPTIRARLRRSVGWEMTSNNTATPIMYNPDRYLLVAQGTVKALPEGVRVEYSPVDNSRSAGPKSVVWAQLQDKTSGAAFEVVNTHMLVGKGEGPKRQAAYNRQLAAVTQVVTARRALGNSVVITGDFNDNWKPTSPTSTAMAAVGAIANWQTLGQLSTHGAGTLDDVWSAGAAPTSHVTLPARGSDHHPVVVTFTAAPAQAPAAGGGPVPANFDQQGNSRTVEQAITYLEAGLGTRGIPGYNILGHCEGYMTRAYGHAGGYPTAIAHWNAAGPRTKGMSVPPRGAIVFWRTGNPAGHVALSLGNGQVISTDYDSKTGGYSANTISAGPITDIDKWGPRLGWRAPNFKVNSERGENI